MFDIRGLLACRRVKKPQGLSSWSIFEGQQLKSGVLESRFKTRAALERHWSAELNLPMTLECFFRAVFLQWCPHKPEEVSCLGIASLVSNKTSALSTSKSRLCESLLRHLVFQADAHPSLLELSNGIPKWFVIRRKWIKHPNIAGHLQSSQV